MEPHFYHMNEKIELLSVDLLEQNRLLVVELKKLASSLGLDFGWHYLLDLTWIITQLGPVENRRILDAGAGSGILQWYLAEHGAQVVSVDRFSRSLLPVRFRRRYHCQGLRPKDLDPISKVFINDFGGLFHKGPASGFSVSAWSGRISNLARDVMGLFVSPVNSGKVWIYNQDLAALSDLPNNSIDAIVSISALEHNPPEDLPVVVHELMRVLKPGSSLVATLTASSGEDRWHTPSAGWCYSSESIQRLFSLPPDTHHNYADYERLFSGIKNCSELRQNLAGFYFKSDRNGMPWGIWDPQYLPVGVCKLKKQHGRTMSAMS
jgi:2-polyprenyl-3-methyl-5-hydroxy-6-metoxy-1,4-benzoquinol methylase